MASVNEPPRVLHVITVLSVGGVEMWLMALLRYLNSPAAAGENREHFDILMTGGRTNELDELASSLGATLYYVRFGRRNAIGFTRKFRKLLRERQYVAIHDHQDYASAWHFLAGAGDLPPVRIVHIHSAANRLANSLNSPLRKLSFPFSRGLVRKFATHVLGTSEESLRDYGFDRESFRSQHVRRLHCGFDVAPFAQSSLVANASVCNELGWPAGTPITLFVGRLDGYDPSDPRWNHKNPAFALDVVREAIASGVDVHFVMVGGGEPTRSELEQKVTEWGLSDRVRLVGMQLDVARYMAAAHCLLFPSREEGLGMVAVEAQAAGLRVIASDTVPREAVVIQELMSFLPLAAGPHVWAKELAEMLALPRYDVETASNAVRSSDYSIDKSYESLHAIYSTVPK
jgi:glycosyltransferase involved in cell wall biosynthesis